MAVGIAQTANPAGASAASNQSTYSGVSIGTASNDRVVLVVVGGEIASFAVASVTIDDIAMQGGTQATFGSMGAYLAWKSWPTGTTATIVINWTSINPTNVQNHIAVYAITDAKFPPAVTSSSTSTDMDASSPLTTGSQTIPTNGGFLAVAVGATDTVAKTWANATVDIEADAGDFRFTTATRTSSGTVTITCTGGTNNEDGAMVFVVLHQQAIPPRESKKPQQAPLPIARMPQDNAVAKPSAAGLSPVVMPTGRT